MKTIRLFAVGFALVASIATIRAEVVAIRDDIAGSPTSNTITSASGKAKILAISPKSTAYLRFDTASTTILPLQVNRAFLTIYFTGVNKPGVNTGNVTIHNLTTDFSESFAEKSKAAPTFDAAPFATVSARKGEFATVDVTALVLQWLATPATGFGVAIKSDGTAAALLASKEGPGTGHPALLEIELAPNLQMFADDINTTGFITVRATANAQPGLDFMFDDGAGGGSTFDFANTPTGDFSISLNGNTAFSLLQSGPVRVGPAISVLPSFTPALSIISEGTAAIQVNTFGGNPWIFSSAAKGTAAAPTAVTTGSDLLSIRGGGYFSPTSSTSTRAYMTFSASQDWTSSNTTGAEISFATTANNTSSPTERLRITHDGLIKQGSGNGTSQPPSKGVITRRINSRDSTDNQVVATDGITELRRDGTNGGLKVVCVAIGNPRNIAAMGINTGGGNVNAVATLVCNNLGNAVQIYTDGQAITLATISFGDPVQDGDLTILTLHRGPADNYYIGTMTSTVNQ